MQSKQSTESPPVVQKAKFSERSFSKRWKHEGLFVNGYVVVPSQFLRLYAQLKPYSLTIGEAMFVIHLMEFKWGAAEPFPSYGVLAQRMGCSDKLVRRHARSLEEKKYLKRKQRRAATNLFDLSPLFDALLKAIESDQKPSKSKEEAA